MSHDRTRHVSSTPAAKPAQRIPLTIWHPSVSAIVLSAIWCLLASLSVSCGLQLDATSQLGGLASFLVPALIATALLSYPLACLVSWLAQRTPSPRADEDKHKRCCIICIIVLLVAWLAWYLTLFPGVAAYDSAAWYLEYSTIDKPLTSQWSIIYSFCYYLFIRLGYLLADNQNVGLAIFSAVQMTWLAYCAIQMLRCVADRSTHIWPMICSCIFLSCVPLIPIMAASTAQDAVFMGACALITIKLIEATSNPKDFWSTPTAAIMLVLDVIVLCLVRNNGLYALLVTLPFVALGPRNTRVKLLGALIVPIIVTFIVQGPLYNLWGVQKATTIQEMLSIPVQQMGRVWNRAENLSVDDRTAIETYINTNALSSYEAVPEISDALKGGLDKELVESDPVAFAGLWLRLGLDYPGLYVEAFLLNGDGLWNLVKHYPDARMYHPYLESESSSSELLASFDSRFISFEQTGFIPSIDAILQKLYGWHVEEFNDVPVLAQLSRASTYFYALLFALIIAIERRSGRSVLCAAPVIGIIITVALGPVILCRYVMPLIFSTPVLLAGLLTIPGASRGKHAASGDTIASRKSQGDMESAARAQSLQQASHSNE